MEKIIDFFKREKLLPLYTATNIDLLEDIESILLESDLHLIEVTYRSPLASDAIKKLSQSGKLIVGAGTVRDLATAIDAINNGAKFIVMPGIDNEIIEYCQKNDIFVVPGAVTPTEIMRARNLGVSTVKFFPANIYGGIDAIKSLKGPFFDIQFVPTGGIDEQNMTDYLELENVVCVGGSFIISEDMLIKKGREGLSEHVKVLNQKFRWGYGTNINLVNNIFMYIV